MRVLVFDSGTGGHTFNYHRLLLPALASIADELVVVVGKGALESPFARVQLAAMPATVQWDPSIPPLVGRHVQRQLITRRALKAALAGHRPAHVFVPTADGLSQVLGMARLLGRRDIPPDVETEAALHRCGFAYPASSSRKGLLYRVGYWAHSRAPWTRLFNVDLVAYEWIQRRGGPLAERNFLLPDPVETPPAISRADARRKLGFPEDGLLIGCVGEINHRKGSDFLLAAFRQPQIPSSVRLLLAGSHTEQIKELLRTEYADLVHRGRIISVDRYLCVDELHHAMASLDLVCTPYQRQIAIASIVLRAAAAGRPVLATDYGWCGRMVGAYGLGWNCGVEDPAEFARAIAVRLEQVLDWRPSEVCRRLLQFHAPQNFVAVFTARIRERLGMPPLADIVDWDFVQQAVKPPRR